MGVHCEGAEGASAKPPPRLRRGEISLQRKRPAPRNESFPMLVSRAHLTRQCASCGESSLGARLRTRKVTAQGRCAACDQGGRIERVWHNWLNGGTVGAWPQAPPEAPPLDSARGNCPLTPSRDCVGFAAILLPRAALWRPEAISPYSFASSLYSPLFA